MGKQFVQVSAFVWSLLAILGGCSTDGGDADDDSIDGFNAAQKHRPPPPPPSPSPYHGTPFVIPGAFEAEDYDLGGEGVAYHDSESTNQGGAYRGDGVDIKPTSDSSGQYAVGWMQAGEWLKYTVNVAAAGTYRVNVRVASAYAGKSFHVEFNGSDKSGTMSVPNTGPWDTAWTTVSATLDLSAGQQVMRVYADTDLFDLNTFTFSVATAPPPPPPSGSGIPLSFFGMTWNNGANVSSVPFASFGITRSWDSSEPSSGGLSWFSLNPSRGVYNWTALDARLALVQQKAQPLIYVFGRTPVWAIASGTTCQGAYAPSGCANPPADLNDWKSFVTALASHAGSRIKYYELWNEFDLGEFWSGSVATMLQMASTAYPILHAQNSNVVVLMPSVSSASTSALDTLSKYLQAGGGQYADAFAFHAYLGATPESIVSALAKYKTILATYGQSSKPMFNTEFSWQLPAVTDSNVQVAFVGRTYPLQYSLGISAAVWYAWDNTGGWGGLWQNGTTSPAGIAFRESSKWMVGATMSSLCAQTNSVWTCGFTRLAPTGYKALEVWNANGSSSFAVPSGYVQYRDLAGAIHAITASTVAIGTQPILLESQSAF